jgi:hypothetical protein
LAAVAAFFVSFAGWVWLWVRSKSFERKLRKHDKCRCYEVRKQPHNQA